MRHAMLLCALALFSAACEGPTGPDFGEVYGIVLDPLPRIEGATLTVAVSYRGCAGGDEFLVEHHVKGGRVEVWLRKAELAPCGTFFRENRSFSVPPAVRDAASLYLLSPNQNPYPLRP